MTLTQLRIEPKKVIDSSVEEMKRVYSKYYTQTCKFTKRTKCIL